MVEKYGPGAYGTHDPSYQAHSTGSGAAGHGADILAGLAKPMTVSGLWDYLRLRRTASNANAVLDYRWFVLALDLLHMIGAIDFERGMIRKAAR